MGRPFLFCCPLTGLNVQARNEDDEPAPAGRARYKMFECLACRGFHLVDPSTGKLMSDPDGGKGR